MQISFKATPEEHETISRIVARARTINPELETLCTTMDITAAHANGNPLDLARLEAFPNFDFMHDVVGIVNHLDRETGKLKNFFVPRSSK